MRQSQEHHQNRASFLERVHGPWLEQNSKPMLAEMQLLQSWKVPQGRLVAALHFPHGTLKPRMGWEHAPRLQANNTPGTWCPAQSIFHSTPGPVRRWRAAASPSAQHLRDPGRTGPDLSPTHPQH